MKKIAYLFLFICLISLQSCFDVIEEILLKNDGSGTFKLVLNMSRSKTKLNSIEKMKTINGHDVPTKYDVTQKANELENKLKKIAGISKVKTELDFDNYIATISLNFFNVTNLNAAAKSMNDKAKTKGVDKLYEYDAANKVFSRINKVVMKNEYQKMSNADKEIFATATYTSIFRFENDVTGTTNADSKIAGNKKAVMIKANAMDIITNKKSIENKINLNK